jgi:hypothetical protein
MIAGFFPEKKKFPSGLTGETEQSIANIAVVAKDNRGRTQFITDDQIF